jgi:hypothetical protein
VIKSGIALAMAVELVTVIFIIVGAAIIVRLDVIGMAVLEWFQ